MFFWVLLPKERFYRFPWVLSFSTFGSAAGDQERFIVY